MGESASNKYNKSATTILPGISQADHVQDHLTNTFSQTYTPLTSCQAPPECTTPPGHFPGKPRLAKPKSVPLSLCDKHCTYSRHTAAHFSTFFYMFELEWNSSYTSFLKSILNRSCLFQICFNSWTLFLWPVALQERWQRKFDSWLWPKWFVAPSPIALNKAVNKDVVVPVVVVAVVALSLNKAVVIV